MHKMKARFGQFFTTNCEYILQGINLDDRNHKFIEPFTGNADILKHYNIENAECYDIQPRNTSIIQRDTLRNPPSFSDKFVITNPPYLARNKCNDKEIYEKYGEDDLYKCFLKILIENPCVGGILILPVNFLSCPKLLKSFIDVYQILKMNVFEEQVFDDTTSSVCSFAFNRRESTSISFPHHVFIQAGTLSLSCHRSRTTLSPEEKFITSKEAENTRRETEHRTL